MRTNPPTITIEQMTPEKAATLLGTMAANRPLRQRAVRRYAREMIAGKWLLNGEAIKVDTRGKLIDGQHRLNAVLMAKVTVQMLLVRGVDESAMITLDTGVGRSFYDVGVLAGRPYAQAVGPIIRWWHKYQTGSPTVAANVASHQEMEAIIEAHPGIAESAAFIARHKVLQSRCVASVQGFVHAYASEKYDREMADTFMTDLNDGSNLQKTDAAFHLRRRLVDTVKARMEAPYVLALTIKAWNAWMDGDKVSNLVWRTGGDVPEPFPRFGVDQPQKKVFRLRQKKVS